MRRYTALILALAAALATLVPAAPASAAKRKQVVKPTITRVTPMRITVGDTLTIRGKNFKARPKANTVVFQGADGRTAFVKPRRASKRKLVLKVPASVARLLTLTDNKQQPTRMRLRVLAGRFSAFTPRRLSPVVLGLNYQPPGGPGVPGGTPPKVCKSDADHDNDLLTNDEELAFGTDPCLADTDGDSASDGWELYSAKDLNIKAVPYPDKRPFPNPLDPSDRKVDFDGDGLNANEEYRAWRFTGSEFSAAQAGGIDLQSPLGYSDGTKFSQATETPFVPQWRSASYGLTPPSQPFPATFNLNGDGSWRDDERDADRDGLSNWLESEQGPSNAAWQMGFWSQDEYGIPKWPKLSDTCDQAAGLFDQRPFADLDLADPDVDGNTLLDGEDDQDNDDFTNIEELYEIAYDLDGDGQTGGCPFPVPAPSMDIGGSPRLVNAFNPCAPDPSSRTCPDYQPL